MCTTDGTVVARKLCKSFGRRPVLRDIDLTVAAGEISCIIGPSGSGKSTLLRCINGLETVDQGVLRVNGEDFGYVEHPDYYRAVSPRRLAQQRTRIGMVFQQFNLFPNMTAEANVMSGPVLVKKTEKRAARERVGEVLGVMRDLAGKGMTMLVVTHEMGFAREVAKDVLFMDEGVAVERGDAREVLSNPKESRTRAFLEKVL